MHQRNNSDFHNSSIQPNKYSQLRIHHNATDSHEDYDNK